MYRDYKVYYNDSHLLISTDGSQMNKNFGKVISTQSEAELFLKNHDFIYDGTTNINYLIIVEKSGELMCQLMENTDVIIAGGGIVFNEKDELLMIHRRGKWDLPKGKIELNEDILEGAVREVTEETGVKVADVKKNSIRTYHAYTLKKKRAIKETSWFVMKAKPGQSKLTAQTEEDIEEARWVSRNDIHLYQTICYPLIWDLIKQYAQPALL
jgi:8-oxo-dGTP pyrophosphatase MutT (NUDIX family)